MKSKYGNRKTVIDGIVFDSKREAQRYAELRLLLWGGEISDLRRQVSYELIPAQYGERVTSTKTGKSRSRRICLERAVKYVADFVYTDVRTGETVVEDAKGKRTKEYIIKRKLMLERYGIRVREV